MDHPFEEPGGWALFVVVRLLHVVDRADDHAGERRAPPPRSPWCWRRPPRRQGEDLGAAPPCGRRRASPDRWRASRCPKGLLQVGKLVRRTLCGPVTCHGQKRGGSHVSPQRMAQSRQGCWPPNSFCTRTHLTLREPRPHEHPDSTVHAHFGVSPQPLMGNQSTAVRVHAVEADHEQVGESGKGQRASNRRPLWPAWT